MVEGMQSDSSKVWTGVLYRQQNQTGVINTGNKVKELLIEEVTSPSEFLHVSQCICFLFFTTVQINYFRIICDFLCAFLYIQSMMNITDLLRTLQCMDEYWQLNLLSCKATKIWPWLAGAIIKQATPPKFNSWAISWTHPQPPPTQLTLISPQGFPWYVNPNNFLQCCKKLFLCIALTIFVPSASVHFNEAGEEKWRLTEDTH